MINGCRSADSIGISPHSRRHARGGRGQIPRVHGDLRTRMDPPDIRRSTGGCHARCLHHPGPHPARSHWPTGCVNGRGHAHQLAYRSTRFFPLKREKLSCSRRPGGEPRGSRGASQPPRRLSRRRVSRDLHDRASGTMDPPPPAMSLRDARVSTNSR